MTVFNDHLASPGLIMNAEQYIKSELEKLKTPLGLAKSDDLEAQIVRLLLSKKFRKYSANKTLIQHVKDVVHFCVSRNQPINLTFLHGAYKLWRLDEAPEVDFAELFSLMYYTKYVKPICEIYEPGVWFDFFVDDWIVEIMDNYAPEEIEAYIRSYQTAIDYLKAYQPANLKMTITPVSSAFASRDEFDAKLTESLANTPMPSALDEKDIATIELNVRPAEGQTDDPLWREKLARLEGAYLAIKGGTGYHKGREDKILTFSQPLPSGSTISLGTTKSSIVKFWVGVGALKPDEKSYKMIILSPKQLEETSCRWENVGLGLAGKNFARIRIIDTK